MKKLLLSCGTILLTSTMLSAQTLVGHWPFNGNANDVSGNGLNGTVYGATLTTDENNTPNEAYYFNGTSAHIDLPTNNLLNLTTWTLQASVYIEAFNPSACQGEFFISKGIQSSNNFYFLGFSDNIYGNTCSQYTPDSTVFQAGAIGLGNPTMWNTNNFILLNHWYCLTATYANDTVKLYKDGTLINAGYWPGNYMYGPSEPSLSFGYYNQGGNSVPFYVNGKIEDVAIWNGVISDSAIAAYCGGMHFPTAVPQVSNNAENLVVSPNPATTMLSVQSSNKNNTVLYIINELGQVMQSANVHSTSATLDISKLSPGLYFVRTTAEDGSIQVAKFVKE